MEQSGGEGGLGVLVGACVRGDWLMSSDRAQLEHTLMLACLLLTISVSVGDNVGTSTTRLNDIKKGTGVYLGKKRKNALILPLSRWVSL